MNKKKLIAAAMAALTVAFAVSACSGGSSVTGGNEPGISQIEWENADLRAEQFVMALVNGDYSVAASGFDAAMKRALSVPALKKSWEDTVREAGTFISIAETQLIPHDEYEIYHVVSQHEKSGINTRIVFSADGLVAGLFFSFVPNPGEPDMNPVQRDGFTDIPVIIGEDTDFPLVGIISMPDNRAGKVPAVVLVHGSGPMNMDSAAYGITVFRDIAEYLAKNGIAVLRYDKRTYTHGAKLAVQFGDDITVREETIEDAILAKVVLEKDQRIDSERIFVAGHSLGGMLTPRIASEGDFAGGIIMAGSPRSLLDIIYDQNMYYIGQMVISESERSALLAQVDESRADFFTLPEIYFKEMDEHPAETYLTSTSKPFLIIHGGKDFQVRAEIDFALYEKIAEGRNNIELRLYNNLNHLFTVSTMENPTTDDYIAGTSVDIKPLSDIAAWLNARV